MPSTIADLRAFLARPGFSAAHARVPLGHAAADLCLNGGLRRGVLHEVFAIPSHEVAATGFTAGLATRMAAGRRVMWITLDFSAREFGGLSPTGFLEFGLHPDRLLLFRAANPVDALQVAHDALSCAALSTVVLEMAGEPKSLDLKASRRLSLAAAQQNVTVCMLRFTAKVSASAAETRWQVRGLPSWRDQTWGGNWGHAVFEASLTRHRNGATGRWIMEWSCDHGLFQTPAPHSGSLVSLPPNRPPAARRAKTLAA